MDDNDEQPNTDATTQSALIRDVEWLSTSANAAIASQLTAPMREVLAQQKKTMQLALLPLREWSIPGTLKMPATQMLSTLNKQVAHFNDQFRLPPMPEVQRLFRQYQDHSNIFSALRVQSQWPDAGLEIRRAMAAMHQPWLDVQNMAKSFSAFGDLQGIGLALRTIPPFEVKLAEQLRSSLGDWQSRIDFTQYQLVDPGVRTDLYIARGLDPALTAFPADTFLESTTIAGLRPSVQTVEGEYDEVPASNEDEDGINRTNAAHKRLFRFEIHLRNFIETHMRAAAGEQWIKQRVPGPIKALWTEKRQRDIDAGEQGHPLIEYADFTDYLVIITRKDNWEGVFEKFFKRSTLVQESLQRLYPIRLCTMHARMITQDDELYLLVETKRLLKAMGIDLK